MGPQSDVNTRRRIFQDVPAGSTAFARDREDFGFNPPGIELESDWIGTDWADLELERRELPTELALIRLAR